MNILHLSDLHLGKRIFETSMLPEQRVILAQALEMADNADAVLIAGDIYDKPVPPAEAVTLLDGFLTAMSEKGKPVVMISGNHDSAERVAFGAELLASSGVHVSPAYDGCVRRVELADEFGPVHIHLLPFIKPAHVRAALCDEEIEGYTAAVHAAIEAMDIDRRVRNVLVAHQFVTGSMRSESEEIVVGGVDNVDADVFAPFDYVALGHLHAAQSLCGGRVRYCGAPLSYAFSECEREKTALMVHIGEQGEIDVHALPFTPAHAMRRIKGKFHDLLDPEKASEDYIQITLTDEDDLPDAARKLQEIYPNLLQVLYDNARTRAAAADFSREAQVERSPLTLFETLYDMQNGAPLSEAQRALLSGMIERIWEEHA